MLPFHLRMFPFHLRTSPFHLRMFPFHLRVLPFLLRMLPFHLRILPFHFRMFPFHLRLFTFHFGNVPVPSPYASFASPSDLNQNSIHSANEQSEYRSRRIRVSLHFQNIIKQVFPEYTRVAFGLDESKLDPLSK